MYTATVYRTGLNGIVDAMTVPFGKWSEIGYWLDDRGFNQPQYKVVIRFVEV